MFAGRPVLPPGNVSADIGCRVKQGTSLGVFCWLITVIEFNSQITVSLAVQLEKCRQ